MGTRRKHPRCSDAPRTCKRFWRFSRRFCGFHTSAIPTTADTSPFAPKILHLETLFHYFIIGWRCSSGGDFDHLSFPVLVALSGYDLDVSHFMLCRGRLFSRLAGSCLPLVAVRLANACHHRCYLVGGGFGSRDIPSHICDHALSGGWNLTNIGRYLLSLEMHCRKASPKIVIL